MLMATVTAMRRIHVRNAASSSQVADAAERAQVGLLRGILGQRLVAQDAKRDGKHHPLGGLDEPPVGGHIAPTRPTDEFVQRFHGSRLLDFVTSRTREGDDCDMTAHGSLLCFLELARAV